jgi:hypothetical protein
MNHIFIVEEVDKRVRTGYPNGVDETSIKQLPLLLKRIQELENALAPFARIGARSGPGELPLQNCYTKDCVEAYNVLDPSNTWRAKPVQQQEIPAELF